MKPRIYFRWGQWRVRIQPPPDRHGPFEDWVCLSFGDALLMAKALWRP